MANYKNLRQPDYSARFVFFDNKIPKTLIISDWDTKKQMNDVLFKCYVIKEDDKEVDKLLTAFDFDFAEQLKKVVKGKKSHQKIKIKVLMTEIDDFEKEYEVKEIKE